MQNLSVTPFQLSNLPLVNSIVPGTNITVDKSIGDVTVSAGGMGEQAQVAFSLSDPIVAIGASFSVVSTLSVNITSQTPVVTLNYGFGIYSTLPTTLVFRVSANNVVFQEYIIKVDLTDEDAVQTLNLFWPPPAIILPGVFNITLECRNAFGGNVNLKDIYSYALWNLLG
jgi:hypothetical protein